MNIWTGFGQRLRCLWAIAVFAIAGASPLKAASFIVTDLADAGPGTLRQAIFDANAAPGDAMISFATNGTIRLFTGLPCITNNIVITGPGTNLLIISGNNLTPVFVMDAGTTNVLSDLTIAEGLAIGSLQPYNLTTAAGIASASSLVLQRCVIRECRTRNSLGAGIYNAGNLTIADCTITACRASAQSYQVKGSGIYNDGGILHIVNSTISDCHGSCNGPTGSGIYNTAGGELHASKTRIESCHGDFAQSDGGAIVNCGDAEFNGCVIADCHGYWAGGIESFGRLAMTNTTVKNCRADIGGGILIAAGTGLFASCTVSGNDCAIVPGGAGVLNLGSLTLFNCTLSQNASADADLLGTAIADKNFPSALGTTILNHCTIVSNSGPAEIFVEGNLSTANSIIGSLQGTNNSGGHNLIINTNDCVIIGNTNGNIFAMNPLLGPLQDNGGQTFTHALLTGSPAIDQAELDGLPLDQRGFLRPILPTASDIGAFEVVPIARPTLTIASFTPNSIILSWLSAPAGFILQQNSEFDTNSWQDVSTSLDDDGTNRWVALPKSEGNKFYRLRSP